MALNEENERGGYRADSSAGTDEEYFELLDRRRRELARGRADKPENPSTAPPQETTAARTSTARSTASGAAQKNGGTATAHREVRHPPRPKTTAERKSVRQPQQQQKANAARRGNPSPEKDARRTAQPISAEEARRLEEARRIAAARRAEAEKRRAEEEKRRVFGLFGDRDPIVHTFGLFSQHYPQAIHFHGEHRMDDRSFLHGVVPVIRWISDRQEGRERPIVYIDSSTLRDEYGHPKSSLNKAFDLLIEHYQVFVVCPAPTEDPQAIAGWQDWVKETFAAPAWNHVIFTNQKAQLYGDYFIDCHPDANFMGTRVELGSDDMKTWEDVIVFFERLGGQ